MQYCFLLRLLLPIFALLCGSVFVTSTFAAEVEPAVPLKPAELVHIGKFAITNSMLVTWIVAAAIIVFAQLATRKIKAVPTGAQNFWEWLVESLYNFLESIICRDLVRKTFWFFATIFIFILFVNWFGLIPGVGTIGWGHYDERRFPYRSTAAARGQRRSEHDDGNGRDLLFALDYLGDPGKRSRGIPAPHFRTKG